MARARNIKPSFFQNEDLIELPYEARLLFIGLWTLADREGRLENRPKKIKMTLFPADDINVSEQLLNISKFGFIELYTVDGLNVIQVVNFVKHQTPHGLEKDSNLPDKEGYYTVYERNPKNKTVIGKPLLVTKVEFDSFTKKTTINVSASTQEQGYNNPSIDTEHDNNSYETVSISDQNALNPESFNLNPDIQNPEEHNISKILPALQDYTEPTDERMKTWKQLGYQSLPPHWRTTALQKYPELNEQSLQNLWNGHEATCMAKPGLRQPQARWDAGWMYCLSSFATGQIQHQTTKQAKADQQQHDQESRQTDTINSKHPKKPKSGLAGIEIIEFEKLQKLKPDITEQQVIDFAHAKGVDNFQAIQFLKKQEALSI